MSETVKKEIDVLAVRLTEIAQTSCPECGGLGHTRKKCATYKRLIGLTKGHAASRTVMNASRVRVTGDMSKTYAGKRMSWQ